MFDPGAYAGLPDGPHGPAGNYLDQEFVRPEARNASIGKPLILLGIALAGFLGAGIFRVHKFRKK